MASRVRPFRRFRHTRAYHAPVDIGRGALSANDAVLVILSVVALLGGACSKDNSTEDSATATTTTAAAALTGPQKYSAVVDAPSTSGPRISSTARASPKRPVVRTGDTVVFENRSSNDIHTVSFGVKRDRSDEPALLTKAGQPKPAGSGPCFTSQPAGPT